MKDRLHSIVLSVLLLMATSSIGLSQDYDITLMMNGANEVSPNTSSGVGSELGTGYSGCYYDDATDSLYIRIQFSGLSSGVTAAHIHGPAVAGVSAGILIGLTGFPTSVTSGSYSRAFKLTTTNETRLFGESLYVNIHTSTYRGGEIRGQLIIGNILPVELISFSGVANEMSVELHWSTVTETNNYGFYVERRAENEPIFRELPNSFVEGAGTTLEEHHYSWTDANVAEGTYYYRLRQVDLNGDFSYSHAIQVVVTGVLDVWSNEGLPTEF